MLIGLSSVAQSYVNAGYGYCFDKTSFDSDVQKTNSNEFFVGFSYNFTLAGNLGLEPGIGYLYSFGKQGGELLEAKNNHHGIVIPALLNYNFSPSGPICFKLFAGPSASFGISDKTTTYVIGKEGLVIDNYDKESGDYSRFGLSASFGLGLEFANLVRIKLGYDLGLLDMHKAKKIAYTQDAITFSLGFMF